VTTDESKLHAFASADVAQAEPLGQAMLALNNAHAEALSWLEPERLQFLAKHALFARRIGDLDAFILALDQDAPYDSPNFLWFRVRYDRFVYVDRIVIAPAARGRGYARLLYRELFDQASAAGYARVVCEVNVQPPNRESDTLHTALGFAEVGRASIHNDSKIVRYLLRKLETAEQRG
jgi:predicted GNAT superfamily acetyltransferase